MTRIKLSIAMNPAFGHNLITFTGHIPYIDHHRAFYQLNGNMFSPPMTIPDGRCLLIPMNLFISYNEKNGLGFAGILFLRKGECLYYYLIVIARKSMMIKRTNYERVKDLCCDFAEYYTLEPQYLGIICFADSELLDELKTSLSFAISERKDSDQVQVKDEIGNISLVNRHVYRLTSGNFDNVIIQPLDFYRERPVVIDGDGEAKNITKHLNYLNESINAYYGGVPIECYGFQKKLLEIFFKGGDINAR